MLKKFCHIYLQQQLIVPWQHHTVYEMIMIKIISKGHEICR